MLNGVSGLNKESRLKTRIIPLRWPPGVIPSELPDFETKARGLRYQALGKACYLANIPSLLLGHHKADQDETVIMRLVGGFRGEGLRGISEEADIPHCLDVYGAGQSGGSDYTVTWEEKQMMKARESRHQGEILPSVKEYRKKGFEYGGVRIYRPLMRYSKQELEATLQAAGVSWVTDSTNYDPTLSIRNAIRYLMQRRLLPRALDSGSPDRPSALSIAANNIGRRYERRNGQAEFLFQACDIASFDTRSGLLKVRIPLFPAPNEPNFYLLPEDRQRTEIEHIGARLVRLLLSIVSPRQDISLQTLEFATKVMFFNFERGSYAGARPDEEYSLGEESISQLSNFTAGDVFCSRVESSSEELPFSGAQPYMLDPDHIWCISRKPYVNHQPEPILVVSPAAPIMRSKAKTQVKGSISRNPDFPPTMMKTEQPLLPEPEWQLWDRRYWLQVLNPTESFLKICPLTQSRLNRLKENFDRNNDTTGFRKLKETLKAIGPLRVRHTLPAIVDKEDNVLALPTLDLAFLTLYSNGSDSKSLNPRWRVRFKKVVLPDHVKHERILALKDEKIEGLQPRFSRIAEEGRGEREDKEQGEEEEYKEIGISEGVVYL